MEARSVATLDGALSAVTLVLAAWTAIALLSAGAVRVRVRRSRRWPRRWLPALSVAFALSSSAAGAGGRSPLDRTFGRHHAPAPPWARPGGPTPPLPPGGPGAPSPLPPWEAKATADDDLPARDRRAPALGALRLGRPALPGRLLFSAERHSPARGRSRGGRLQADPLHPALHGGRRAGQQLRPLFARAGHEPRRTVATYVVRPGDSLWDISAALLNSTDPARLAAAWPRLYRLNAKTIGPDPGLIHPGTVLRLPASWPRRAPR